MLETNKRPWWRDLFRREIVAGHVINAMISIAVTSALGLAVAVFWVTWAAWRGSYLWMQRMIGASIAFGIFVLTTVVALAILRRRLPQERGNQSPSPELLSKAQAPATEISAEQVALTLSYSLELSAENGPGKALVRVDNRGLRSNFTATATVLKITERVPNTKFLQTYGLRWRSNGKDELTLEAGAVGSLLIASSGETIRRLGERDLCELRLEGYEDGKPGPVDWFRWHGGDPAGAVTIDLDITVSPGTGQGVVSKGFRVTSREWGGVLIEELPNKP
jgi:hypothetical protein